MNRLLRWLGLDPESKDCVVICGPIGAGKRSILHHIAVDATLIQDTSPLCRKTFQSNIYPKLVFRIWEHSCAVGMHYRPEWPEYIPVIPLGLILVIDGANIPLYNTIKSGLAKLLTTEPLRSIPLLFMINKLDLQGNEQGFITADRLHKDLNIPALEEQGFKCYITSTTIYDTRTLLPGLQWLNRQADEMEAAKQSARK